MGREAIYQFPLASVTNQEPALACFFFFFFFLPSAPKPLTNFSGRTSFHRAVPLDTEPAAPHQAGALASGGKWKRSCLLQAWQAGCLQEERGLLGFDLLLEDSGTFPFH